MKVATWAISLLLCLMMFSITGCPTCVGRMKRSDEPFFSDAFYNQITSPHTKSPQEQPLEDDVSIDEDEEEELGGSS